MLFYLLDSCLSVHAWVLAGLCSQGDELEKRLLILLRVHEILQSPFGKKLLEWLE